MTSSQVDAEPPGPGTLATLAIGPRFRRDPLGTTASVVRRYGDVICSRFGPWRFYTVFQPAHVQHVLHDHHDNYVKGALVARARILIGDGLVTSEGTLWRRQRRTIQPAFHRPSIVTLAPAITAGVETMLAGWNRRAADGAPLDLAAEMTRLTLDIAGMAFFGVELGDEARRVGDALRVALAYLNRRLTSLLPLPTALPLPQALRFRRARDTLDRLVADVIQRRRRAGAADRNMLSLLLAARDPETGEAMSDRQVRDEVMTFVLAGHETTALTLTWALYLLARHPEIDTRVRAEIHAALGDRSPTPDDLPRLPYTRAVLDETLRLYPPLWAFGREPIADDRIGGYRIRAGSSVAVVPWITHRLPDVWPDPERFDPERFTGLGARARPRYAYLPFGGGPRQCIGSEFALMEAHLVLPAIVRAYRVELVDDRPVEPYPTVTLRPRTAITARLRPAA